MPANIMMKSGLSNNLHEWIDLFKKGFLWSTAVTADKLLSFKPESVH